MSTPEEVFREHREALLRYVYQLTADERAEARRRLERVWKAVDRLPELEVPTLLVSGAAEAGAGVGADTLRALLPRVSLQMMEEAGHLSFLERPAAIRRLLRDFLAETHED